MDTLIFLGVSDGMIAGEHSRRREHKYSLRHDGLRTGLDALGACELGQLPAKLRQLHLGLPSRGLK